MKYSGRKHSQELILKNIDETINYLIEEINRNELMSKRQKMICTTLNYIEHFFILASAIAGCAPISAFASLIGIPTGITSSTMELKICATTAWIKKYKSIIEKKKKNHNKTVLLVNAKLNRIEILISKSLIDSNISHDVFVLINNVLKESEKMKEEIQNLKTLSSLSKILVYL